MLENLRQKLNEDNLMILGGCNTPWLYQDNDYLPVKKALNYLEEQVGKSFDGGFLLKENELKEFIPHLFWLVRCNASLPEFYISYPKSNTIINICKYGVLHFEFYSKDEKDAVLQLSSSMKFQRVETCYAPINFDDFEGRNLKITD